MLTPGRMVAASLALYYPLIMYTSTPHETELSSNQYLLHQSKSYFLGLSQCFLRQLPPKIGVSGSQYLTE